MDVIKVIFIVVFPLLRIGGMPMLMYLPFAAVNFIVGGRGRVDREYLAATLTAFAYLFFHILFTLRDDKIPVGQKDYFYCLIPWIFLVLLGGMRYSGKTYWVLKIYFYANLLMALLAKVPLQLTRKLIHLYYVFGIGNIVSNDKYLEHIVSRPGGMLIHPPWFGFMMYLLGRFFFTREKKGYYLAIALFGIVLSGAKGALVSFMLIEGMFFLGTHRSLVVKAAKAMLALLLAGALLALICALSPYFRGVIDTIMADYRGGEGWNFYSIKYRVDIYEWAFVDIRSFLLGGAISTSHLGEIGRRYIDSELVMRSLQFGFIGYLALLGNYAAFYIRSLKARSELTSTMGKFIILFVILGSLTTTIATNMIFMLFMVIVIDLCERDEAGFDGEPAK
jgi:hypothetical protein